MAIGLRFLEQGDLTFFLSVPRCFHSNRVVTRDHHA